MQSEAKLFSNFSATQGPFTLRGGTYAFAASGTWNSGSLTLEALGPDGSTYLPVLNLQGGSAAFTANGWMQLYLPPGQYELVVGGSPSALYASLASVQT